MAESFQNEVPKARVNIKLDLHTGGASKKVELPLKLLVMGDYSNGQNTLALGERTKVSDGTTMAKRWFSSALPDAAGAGSWRCVRCQRSSSTFCWICAERLIRL